MKPESDFYIGWQEKAPSAFRKKVRWFIVVLTVVVPVLAVLLVGVQREFSGAVFEYGTQTTLEGELIRTPVPFLRVPVKNAAGEKGRFERILLIGLGKHGADPTLNQWEAKHGSLTHKTLTISGTLIYHDGKAALELTKQADALVRVSATVHPATHEQPQDLGQVTLSGEITDPKCTLGVMKPGDGRPHRSCAVRCIAGGIPPLLAVRGTNSRVNYYIITSSTGQPLNAQISTNVGRPVQLSGRLEQVDNWLILYTNSIQPLTQNRLDTSLQITMCH